MRSLLLGTGFVLALAIPQRADAIEVEIVHAPTERGQTSTFSATVSDAVGTVEYRWDFGDGTDAGEWSADLASVSYDYAEPGHYPVNLLVRDDATPFAGHAFTHTVYEPLAAGTPVSSTTIVYDQARGIVCNANPDNDTVTIVDANGLTKLAEIPVYARPSSLALAPDGTLWVLAREDYAIAIIDLDALEVTGGLRLPYASQPMGIVMGPEHAYVSLMATGQVITVEVETKTVGDPVSVGGWPRGLALSGDGATLWVTRFISEQHAGHVAVLDTATMSLRSTIELPVDPGPDTDQTGRGVPNYLFSVALSPDGQEAWVTGKKDNVERGVVRDGEALTEDNTVRPMLASIDVGSGAEVLERRLDLDDRNLPAHVTFSPLGDYAFVTVLGSAFIDVRDAYGLRTSAADLKEAGLGPRASVLGPDGKLFVHGWLSRTVVVFDVSQILASVDFKAVRLAEIPTVERESLAPEVLRGKQVFYDSEDVRMTAEGYISCGTCHFDGFEDGRIWDFTDRGEGLRNNISLLGRRGTGHGRVHWSGNFDEIQDFEHDIRNAFGGAGFIGAADYPGSDADAPLGASKAGLDADLDALAAFVTSLDAVHRSPHRNDDGSMTEDAVAGEAIFARLACDTCHGGDDFTDSAEGNLHDVGTLLDTSGQRLGMGLPGIDTPTLLGIWETGPYLHDGSAPTIRDVLTTRNAGDLHGEVSTLSSTEVDQLVAFLGQIDGHDPPERLPFEPEPSADSRGCRVGGAPPSWLVLTIFGLAWVRRSGSH